MSLLFTLALVLPTSSAQEKTKEEREQKVVLTLRKENGEYGTSAFSFRYETQDAARHKNAVDLVFNRCGLLHINAHGGMKNRIADLGKAEFAKVEKAPEKGWREECVRPVEGHVYYQVVEYGEDDDRDHLKFAVKFVVTKIKDDTVELKWAVVGKRPAMRDNSLDGENGAMGQCGGEHRER